jgi:hypothetical protein
MATQFTVSVTSVFLNNQGIATTVTRTVPAVVVGNDIRADINQIKPGVVNSQYTEFPFTGIN